VLGASDAVFFTDAGPIPAWFVHGMSAALKLPCRCAVPADATAGHLAGCARGEAVATLQERARTSYGQENP
jgi:hypothetical protein